MRFFKRDDIISKLANPSSIPEERPKPIFLSLPRRSQLKFTLKNTDPNSAARSGEIETDHGVVQTPIFAPVGTYGSVRGIHTRELEDSIGIDMLLGNAYHLFVRPGLEILEQAGGIHKFTGWNKPVLTDSGGYQVYSLAANRKISEEGVSFQSHLDGTSHFFSPEVAIENQIVIGADMIMAFDECTPYPCEYDYAKNSMDLTHKWLGQCIDYFDKSAPKYGYSQSLLPIVQGSVYEDLRMQSAEFIAGKGMEGNAIGGLSVGEPHEEMYAMCDIVCGILPKDKARYLMGVGTPANILECIALGIDMFDCVMPTRNGRNGTLYTSEGMINIKNEKWKNDFSPLDPSGNIYSDQDYSKAYLRHLIISNEMLGAQIASLHNVNFYLWLVREARIKIDEGTFTEWKNIMVKKLIQKI